ncbi:ATP-dependent helicase, partial [Patescibacteria group bacterium]|nr:ATP-dependent helicase [Patescibacteria group bacterium]
MDSKTLNKEQLKAINYNKGPLLIVAGAGTGKTTVIVERIKQLISSGKADFDEILALTFTDKAAREMEERVDLAIPYGYSDMWIYTFHRFCDQILRQEALQIGLDPDYKLMSTPETTQFLINNLFKFDLSYFRPLGNPTKFISGILSHFSRLKDEDISPDGYLKFAKNFKGEEEEAQKLLELAAAYKSYEDLKAKQGLMDFSDLISNALKLFRTRKSVLKKYQEKFKYILIDEFQDTNIAQNELALLLCGKDKNIAAIGDEDQSIYRFRGAAMSNIIQFKKNFPKAKTVILTKNYRSTQTILDSSYKLIQNNNPDRLEVKEGISKKLISARKEKGAKIEFIHAKRVEIEAELVAEKIKELSKDYDFKDFAVLVRANNHAEPFLRALVREQIPAQFLGPGQLFRQPEVKDLISYLEVLYNFENDQALFRVLSMEVFDLFARDLAAVNNFARRKNIPFFAACERIEDVSVSADSREKILKFVKMVHRHLEIKPKESAGQILYYFLQDSDLLKDLADFTSVRQEKRAQNISRFFDRVKDYEANHEDSSIDAVVDWINLSMMLGDSPLASNEDWTEENKVNLLTVHSAKGLEFKIVFLVNLVNARFPSNRRSEQIPIAQELIKEILPEGDFHIQEERRLFYVGMTRAKDKLFLTAADYYGDGKRAKKISSFVKEALGEGFFKERDWEKQLSVFDFKPLPEEKEKRSAYSLDYLSFSQLNLFLTCPLQYRFRYIQKVPTPPAAQAIFGQVIHKTLNDFYKSPKDKQSLKNLLKLLDKNWLDEGYSSKIIEKKYKSQARAMLGNFFKKEYDSRSLPDSLEQSFVIKMAPGLRVGGRMDRVDREKDKIEIIDYKTGKAMDQKAAD